ncbi:20785_t:CDS:2, partial [Gigaspora margarita]
LYRPKHKDEMNMISKLNERMDAFVNQQQTQTVQKNSKAPTTTSEHNHEYDPTTAEGSGTMNQEKIQPQQGNCPLTPILNNLIISAAKTSNEKI